MNYCVTRRELLAIVHNVQLFKNYLLLQEKFLVRTDHSSLRYLHRFKEPEGQLARWLDILQPYTFEIAHRAGEKHANADALSRRPDPCDGKKCYCQSFDDLAYEPPVVLESFGVVDVAVQATPSAMDSECVLSCCGVRSIRTDTCDQESVSVQTKASVNPLWNMNQKNIKGVTLFFYDKTPLSNFYPCKFVGPDGKVYNCNEQYYQGAKVLASGDRHGYEDIMQMTNPRHMKSKAKHIRNLDVEHWREVSGEALLEEGCWCKFDQNPELAHHLLCTTEEVIAEASPYDRFFGIGLGMNHPNAGYPQRWRGKNKMGEILMRVRHRLRLKNSGVMCRAVSIQPLWSRVEISQAQENDPDISPVLDLIKSEAEKPAWESVSAWSENSKLLLQEWNCLVLKDGVLKRRYVLATEAAEFYQMIVPRSLVSTVLQFAHDTATAGHLGVKKTRARVRARFWWPKCRQEIRRYVQSCSSCQKNKGPSKRLKAPLQKYTVGCVGERVASDIMGPFSETDSGNRYIVVFICYFSKYATCVPIPDITAATVAKAFLEHWVCYLGVPLELHSDQGSQYCSDLMHGLCKLLGIVKTRTTPLRPQGDGLAERLNRTIISILRGIVEDCPFDWDILLPMATMAYNSSENESTGETPNAIIFGRENRLPIALLDPTGDTVERVKAENSAEYVLQLQRKLQDIHHRVRGNLHKAALKQEHSYNNRLKYTEFNIGDSVYYWYPIKGKTPKEKFASWQGPYVIVERISDTVYCIQKSPRSKPLIVNHDSLKQAELREPIDTSWVHKVSRKPKEIAAEEAEAVLSDEAQTVHRPRRSVKAPQLYGEWVFR